MIPRSGTSLLTFQNAQGWRSVKDAGEWPAILGKLTKQFWGRQGGTCYYLTVDVGTVKRKSVTFIHNHHYKSGLINVSFQACYNLSVLTYRSCAYLSVWAKTVWKVACRSRWQQRTELTQRCHLFIHQTSKKKKTPKKTKPQANWQSFFFFFATFSRCKTAVSA